MATGKWNDPDTPKRGWTCKGVTDLEENRMTCEMCEQQVIRYAHEMHHEEHYSLTVGCICAGNMEENIQGATLRENQLKKRQRKKAKWLEKWKRSRRGNLYVKAHDRYHAVIFKKNGHFSGLIEDTFTKEKIYAKIKYSTESEAMYGAFEGIEYLFEQSNRR